MSIVRRFDTTGTRFDTTWISLRREWRLKPASTGFGGVWRSS